MVENPRTHYVPGEGVWIRETEMIQPLSRSAIALAAVLAVSACATPQAGEPANAPAAPAVEAGPAPPQATIPFGASSVRNWRYERETNSLLLEARRQWYRAELFSTCSELDFAFAIGLVPEIGGSIDRWSSVVVKDGLRGYRECRFKSLVEIPDPDAKPEAAAAPTERP